MAKKSVATFRDKSSTKNLTKVIRAVKTEKGSYTFREEMVPTDQVDEFLKTGKKQK